MKRFLKKLISSVSACTILIGSSLAGAADKDIVDTAVAAGSFKTLAAALQAADLVGALKGDGPFTVFAPTDEAFAKLPAGTVEKLLKPENKQQLAGILTYHVVAGKVSAKQVVGLKGAKTLNGQRVDISVADGVTVDNAKVVTTDIVCSNGIIHVIDNVILPSGDDIVATAEKAGKFKTLIAAAKAAGLVGALTGEQELTVFAPTDEAFAKLPAGTVESLLKPESKTKLATILKYHVVAGRVYSEDALKAKQAETLQSGSVSIAVVDGVARVNDAKLVATDIDAANGVIHVIDSVMLPPTSDKKISAVDARQMIESSIAQGAPTFNAGHHDACAQVYMTTVRTLVSSDSHLPSDVVSSLQHVMTQAEHTSCPTERSWTLRRGLDQAYGRMASIR